MTSSLVSFVLAPGRLVSWLGVGGLNRNEDFYAAIAQGLVPAYDVLLTNPPYSGDHIERLLSFVLGGDDAAPTTTARPALLLLPNYVYMKVSQHRHRVERRSAAAGAGLSVDWAWPRCRLSDPSISYSLCCVHAGCVCRNNVCWKRVGLCVVCVNDQHVVRCGAAETNTRHCHASGLLRAALAEGAGERAGSGESPPSLCFLL